jgi:uncharacterized protein (TIGR03086 family)
MGSVLGEIVVDCTDPERVAGFWAEALGWRPQRASGHLWMSASGDPADGGLRLVFVPVPEPKTVKNRVHVDLDPVGCEQPEEVERLLALGASRVDVGQGDVPWVVLADPEGNEFCVLRRRVEAIATDPLTRCVDREAVTARLDAVLAADAALIDAVRPADLAGSTPCAGWDVRTLLDHMVFVTLLYVAMLAARPLPDVHADHLGDDPAVAFRDGAGRLAAAFAQPGILDRRFPSPFGETSGAAMAQHVVNELLVHGWDLARATGQSTDLAPEAAEEAVRVLRAWTQAFPQIQGMYAPEQPAPPDATPADRLAALLGREAQASPGTVEG